MIPYPLDTSIRAHIGFGIAVISIVFAPWINQLFGNFSMLIAPSAMTTFLILFGLFDHFLWKFPGVNHVLGVPNLNGEWSGHVTQTGGIQNPCTVRIKQTWSRISIRLRTDKTVSNTICAAMNRGSLKNVQLQFAYEVRRTTGEHSRRGDGFNTLELDVHEEMRTLTGFYFSDAVYEDGKHMGRVEVAQS